MERHYAAADEVLYHIGFSPAELEGAPLAVLPGDPGRVEPLAGALCDPGGEARKLACHREYTSYLTQVGGVEVLVCSTGMGGPSVAICLEELARAGVRYLIRVGTTGAIQPGIGLGELIINKAAVRLDGTSRHYAPLGFPAVASFAVTGALIAAAQACGAPYHVGISASSDTFWPGQERYDSFTGYVSRAFRESRAEWQQLGVLNYEMETASLFVTAQALGLKAGAVCGVVAQRLSGEGVSAGAVYQRALAYQEAVVRGAILSLTKEAEGLCGL